MNRTKFVLLVCLLPLLPVWGKKPSKLRPPEIEVMECLPKRTTERTVELDGRVRNCGNNKLRDVVLVFKVLAPGNEVVSTQRGPIEDAEMAPGDTAEFHWQMRQPPRGVSVLVTATVRDVEVEVLKSGPYVIE